MVHRLAGDGRRGTMRRILQGRAVSGYASTRMRQGSGKTMAAVDNRYRPDERAGVSQALGGRTRPQVPRIVRFDVEM